jgi:TetR/AcrR family transcriptional regulator
MERTLQKFFAVAFFPPAGLLSTAFEIGKNHVGRKKTAVRGGTSPGLVRAVPAKKTKVQRGKGRPQTADQTVGRDALIQATIELLKTTSHEKINRLEVARFAGVDPRLIRYYFGNMTALFAEVAVQIARSFRDQIADKPQGASAKYRLEVRIRRHVELFLLYPHHAALVAETIYVDGNSAVREGWHDVVRQSLKQLDEIVNDEKDGNRLRAVEHRYLQLVIVGASQIFANSSGLLSIMFDRPLSPTKRKEEFIAFLTDILLNGLKA